MSNEDTNWTDERYDDLTFKDKQKHLPDCPGDQCDLWGCSVPKPCERCGGCKQIASGEEGAPWSTWEALPPESKLAIELGVVYPIDCPDCVGSDKKATKS